MNRNGLLVLFHMSGSSHVVKLFTVIRNTLRPKFHNGDIGIFHHVDMLDLYGERMGEALIQGSNGAYEALFLA